MEGRPTCDLRPPQGTVASQTLPGTVAEAESHACGSANVCGRGWSMWVYAGTLEMGSPGGQSCWG